MKKDQMFYRALSILCLLAFVLAACAPAATQTTAPDAEEPAATEPSVSEPEATEPAATESAAGEPVTLTYLTDDSENSQARAKALIDAYTAQHPNVTITVELRPQGSEGDNIVKTRLATGEMTDLFFYNSGSLLQALQPADTLVDLTDEPFMDNVVDSFKSAVSQNGRVYGVPSETGMGGGILYNKKVYEELGLSVPTTWEEFAANNEAIKAAGIAPVIQTYGDTWTSQLFVLADYYNVQQAHPNFAEDYTNNEAKYATTPEAMAGFQYLQEGFEKGWWQQDYATAKYDQGLQLLASGEGVHYPMLTFALSTIATNFPDQVKDIGFFAQPGTNASQNGATIWMPAATYIPQTSQNIEAAKDFLAFIASTEGVEALNAAVEPGGPYMIKDASLPDDVIPAVNDIAAYIEAEKSAPALEFLSPVKGPTLEQLTVAVGTGQMTPEEAAAAYDEDVKKQAQQLGLPGWEE
ncbi:MAG TPA: extracellular solute-binding protein [Anaerolineales bacterium]|nr:extracellular solute-binding protein [Anaerolineales bacterium]